MQNWFTIEALSDDTFAISEYRHWEETHCYLLLGTQRALLIDTGLGVGDLRREVEKLTSLPVVVASTHAHWDHIGGHGQFSHFWVHPAEAHWLQGAFPLPRAAITNMLSRDCLLPEGFDLEQYAIFQGWPDGWLEDGIRIDLGRRTVIVLHTPGHSPGHVCFWEETRGWLYSGDLVYEGTIYANYPSTDPQALLSSVERIAALPVQKLFPGHHRLDLSPALTISIRDALLQLRDRGLLRHGSGLFSYDSWAVSL